MERTWLPGGMPRRLRLRETALGLAGLPTRKATHRTPPYATPEERP